MLPFSFTAMRPVKPMHDSLRPARGVAKVLQESHERLVLVEGQ